jgi:predicted Zn-dependent peptidase
MHKPDSETIHAAIAFGFGSANEPDGRHGSNHLIEHLLVAHLERKLASICHQTIVDGMTDTELLLINIKTVRQNLNPVIDAIESLNTLESFDPNDFRQELPAIIGASELELDPYYRVLQGCSQTVMKGSPYEHPVDGYKKDVEKLTLTDCNEIWHAMKFTFGSIVSLYGNVKNAKLDWKTGYQKTRIGDWKYRPAQTNIDMNLKGAECCLGTFDADTNPAIIEFLGFVAGGNSYSQMFQYLRAKTGFAYDTRSIIDVYSTGTQIRLYFGIEKKDDFDKCLETLWDALENFSFDRDNLEFWRESYRCSQVFEMDNPGKFTAKTACCKLLGIEVDPEKVSKYLAKFDPAQMNDFCKKLFQKDRFSLAVVR